MPRSLCRVLLSFFAVLLLALPALAGKPPELSNPLPIAQVSTRQVVPFQINYKDAEDDPPLEAGIELKTPSGTNLTVKFTQNQYATAVGPQAQPVMLNYTPTETGTYQYRFFARDVDGRTLFPDDGTYLTFQVRPDWLPWAIMGAGFVICFLVITFAFYQLFHKLIHSNQTTSARVSLMIGAICWMLSILYAWGWLTNLIAWIAVGVVTILLVVITFATK